MNMVLVIMCESNIHKLSSELTSLMAWHLANKQQKLPLNTYQLTCMAQSLSLVVVMLEFR